MEDEVVRKIPRQVRGKTKTQISVSSQRRSHLNSQDNPREGKQILLQMVLDLQAQPYPWKTLPFYPQGHRREHKL